MIRVVLAVVLTLALLATSLPAIESARIDRTERVLQDDIAGVDDAAMDLRRTDEHVDGPGARRVVEIELPEHGWTAAGVEQVTIPGNGTPPSYRIAERPGRVVGTESKLVRPEDREPITLRNPGRHRLLLTLSERDGERVVVIERFEEQERPGERRSTTVRSTPDEVHDGVESIRRFMSG